MRGSLLMTFDSSDGIGGDNYKVYVNGELRDLHYTSSVDLYSTYLELGDVINIQVTGDTSLIETIDVLRIDYTTDNESGDNGIKQTSITSVTEKLPTSVTFTASTRSDAYKYFYTIGLSFTQGVNIGNGFNSWVFGAYGKASEVDDGYYYLGGNFTSYSGVSTQKLVKLSSDASLVSTTFGSGFDYDVNVISASIYDTSKIFVGGAFLTYNGVSNERIIKLNKSNLSKDTSFNSPNMNGTVYDIIPLSDDSTICVGGFIQYNTNPMTKGIVKLNSNGSINFTYIPYTGVNSGFEVDEFNFRYPMDIVLLDDNSIVVVGGFRTFNGSPAQGIIKFDSSGNIDTSFNYQNAFVDTVGFTGKTVTNIIKSKNGGFYVIGQFGSFSGQTMNKICKLTDNGLLDPSFNVGIAFAPPLLTPLGNIPTAIGEQSDGKIIVAGPLRFYNSIDVTPNTIIRLNTDGTIDNTFNSFNFSGQNLLGLEILDDDSIIIFGDTTIWRGVNYNRFYKVNKDGNSLMV